MSHHIDTSLDTSIKTSEKYNETKKMSGTPNFRVIKNDAFISFAIMNTNNQENVPDCYSTIQIDTFELLQNKLTISSQKKSEEQLNDQIRIDNVFSFINHCRYNQLKKKFKYIEQMYEKGGTCIISHRSNSFTYSISEHPYKFIMDNKSIHYTSLWHMIVLQDNKFCMMKEIRPKYNKKNIEIKFVMNDDQTDCNIPLDFILIIDMCGSNSPKKIFNHVEKDGSMVEINFADCNAITNSALALIKGMKSNHRASIIVISDFNVSHVIFPVTMMDESGKNQAITSVKNIRTATKFLDSFSSDVLDEVPYDNDRTNIVFILRQTEAVKKTFIKK